MGDPQVDAAIAKLQAAYEAATKALTLEIAANLTEAAPVDTGHVRRNFVPSVGAPFEGEDETGAAQAAGIAAVVAWHVGDGDLYVTNNVDYLQYLLLGNSQQAAAGWDLVALDTALQTVEQQFDVSIDVSGPGTAAALADRFDAGDE